jgi:hypothetical protein
MIGVLIGLLGCSFEKESISTWGASSTVTTSDTITVPDKMFPETLLGNEENTRVVSQSTIIKNVLCLMQITSPKALAWMKIVLYLYD